jgi:hypothetical protein
MGGLLRLCDSMHERSIPAPNRMAAQDTGILWSPDAALARSRSERTNARELVFDAARSECGCIEREKNSSSARMREAIRRSKVNGFATDWAYQTLVTTNFVFDTSVLTVLNTSFKNLRFSNHDNRRIVNTDAQGLTRCYAFSLLHSCHPHA